MLCEKLIIKRPERSHFVYQDDPVWYFWIVPSISEGHRHGFSQIHEV